MIPRAMALLAWAFLLGLTAAQAGEIKWQKSPIETRWSFWGMDYTLAGEKLESFQDFSDALTPINDARCDQLLAQSQDSAFWGGIGRLAGTLGVGWGGFHLLFDDSPARRSTNTAVLFTGVGLDLLAALFLEDSSHARYNAVQRYDTVIRGEDDALPAVSVDEKNLLPSSK